MHNAQEQFMDIFKWKCIRKACFVGKHLWNNVNHMQVETILPSGTLPSMPSKKQYASHISPHWSLGGFEEIVAQTSHQSPETILTVSYGFNVSEGKTMSIYHPGREIRTFENLGCHNDIKATRRQAQAVQNTENQWPVRKWWCCSWETLGKSPGNHLKPIRARPIFF